jgi:hypothetical protein
VGQTRSGPVRQYTCRPFLASTIRGLVTPIPWTGIVVWRMVPGLGLEPRRGKAPGDFKAESKGRRINKLLIRCPFPVYESYYGMLFGPRVMDTYLDTWLVCSIHHPRLPAGVRDRAVEYGLSKWLGHMTPSGILGAAGLDDGTGERPPGPLIHSGAIGSQRQAVCMSLQCAAECLARLPRCRPARDPLGEGE